MMCNSLYCAFDNEIPKIFLKQKGSHRNGVASCVNLSINLLLSDIALIAAMETESDCSGLDLQSE